LNLQSFFHFETTYNMYKNDDKSNVKAYNNENNMNMIYEHDKEIIHWQQIKLIKMYLNIQLIVFMVDM